MARGPFAEIPGHKKFDADLRDLGGLARRLCDEAEQKAASAKTDKQRAAFESMRVALLDMTKKAGQIRQDLWIAVE